MPSFSLRGTLNFCDAFFIGSFSLLFISISFNCQGGCISPASNIVRLSLFIFLYVASSRISSKLLFVIIASILFACISLALLGVTNSSTSGFIYFVTLGVIILSVISFKLISLPHSLSQRIIYEFILISLSGSTLILSLISYSRIMSIVSTAILLSVALRRFSWKFNIRIKLLPKPIYQTFLVVSLVGLLFLISSTLPIFQMKGGLQTSRSLTTAYFLDSWYTYLPIGRNDPNLFIIDQTDFFHNILFDSFRSAGLLAIPFILILLYFGFKSFSILTLELIAIACLFLTSIPLEAGSPELWLTGVGFGVWSSSFALKSSYNRSSHSTNV